MVDGRGERLGWCRGERAPSDEVPGAHVVGARQVVPGQGLGFREGHECVEHELQVFGSPGQLGRASVSHLESEDDPLAVVVGPQEARCGHRGWERTRDLDLGTRQIRGARVLLGRDRLDEDAAAVGELEDRCEARAEACRRA